MCGERQQAGLFFDESLLHGARIIVRPRALMGDLVTPEKGLAVQLSQSGERSCGPERLAYIKNCSLHSSFLISCPYLAGARSEVIMRAQVQQPRMKVNLVAAPFQHGTAEVIVEKDSWLARPCLKRVDMATQKIFHTLIEEEFQIQSTRIGKGDQKARQAPTGPANWDFAKVRPIDLPLLSRKEAQSQERLRANWP